MSREEAIAYAERVITLGLNDETQAFCQMAIKALEQNESAEEWYKLFVEKLEKEPCEDAVSRQWLMRKATERFYITNYFNHITKMIEEAPSVKPQLKTGYWKIIPFSNNYGEYRPKEYACSECGWKIDLCRGLQQDTGHRLFCEHCGAKMERSDKK